MKELVRGMRGLNLLMIGLVQVFIHLTVVRPFLEAEGGTSALSAADFTLLVVSVLLIAAGGYLYNDVKDAGADAVNKPGRPVDPRKALAWYAVLTVTGLAGGCYLSFARHLPFVWKIHALSALLLYLYSGVLRAWKFLGNVLVAFLVVLSMEVVWLADPPAQGVPAIRTILYGYGFFAFVLTWVREIVKDLEDQAGDRLSGKRTLPLVAGTRFAVSLATVLLLAVLAALAWIQFSQRQWEDVWPFLYVLVLVEVPLAAVAAGLWRARRSADFGKLSLATKGIMAAGMLSMPVFHLLSQ